MRYLYHLSFGSGCLPRCGLSAQQHEAVHEDGHFLAEFDRLMHFSNENPSSCNISPNPNLPSSFLRRNFREISSLSRLNRLSAASSLFNSRLTRSVSFLASAISSFFCRSADFCFKFITVPVVVLVRFGTNPGALLSDLRFSASFLGFGAVGSRSTFLIYKILVNLELPYC